MTDGKAVFVTLKAINGEPMVVNLTAVRTISTIMMAGDEVSVLSFGSDHEVVVGSKLPEVLDSISAATFAGKL